MLSQPTKLIVLSGLVLAFAGLTVTDAEARHRRGHGHGGGHARHHGGGNAGPAIALGIGAIALGAIIASQNRPQYHQQQSYGYYQQPQRHYGYYQQPQPRYVSTPGYRYETRYDEYGRPYNVRVRCFERYPNAPQGC